MQVKPNELEAHAGEFGIVSVTYKPVPPLDEFTSSVRNALAKGVSAEDLVEEEAVRLVHDEVGPAMITETLAIEYEVPFQMEKK